MVPTDDFKKKKFKGHTKLRDLLFTRNFMNSFAAGDAFQDVRAREHPAAMPQQ